MFTIISVLMTLILDLPVVSYVINTLIMLFQPIHIFVESLDYGMCYQSLTNPFPLPATIKCKLYGITF